MIPYDHDYAGNRRADHQMNIQCHYDGELIWLFMEGCHSWVDGCYTHNWTHAIPMKAFDDIVKCATNAIYLYTYLIEVIPQIQEEVGDIAFAEHEGYNNR